jgi:hypothetical protein
MLKYEGKVNGRRRWSCNGYSIYCWRDGIGVGFTVGVPGGYQMDEYSAGNLRDALSIAQRMIRDDLSAASVRPDLYVGRGYLAERFYKVHGYFVAVYPTPDGIVWEGEYTDVFPADTFASALDDAEEYFITWEESLPGDDE